MMDFTKSTLRASTLGSGLVLLIAALPTAAQAQDSAAVPAEGEAAGTANSFGDIIVTARKREESLLKVPVTLSVITGADVEAKGITLVADLVEATPGINLNSVASGRNDRSFQQISLRGFTPSGSGSTLTATFIDGIPVASPTALNSVTDPARIEILKGPQSAYFGRNAFAGAINVVTKDPGDVIGGTVSAQAGRRNSYDLTGSIDGPIIPGILGFRITGRTFAEDGSYRNRTNPNQTLGDQRTATGTAQLTFTPTPSLKIRAFGLYSEDDDGPSADGMVSAYELRANPDGTINIPLAGGNSTLGRVIVPSQANCTLNGFTFGRAATEARVARPFICGAVPQPGFGPAANTIEDRLLAATLANGTGRILSPAKGTKGYGLVREYVHLHLNVDYEIGDTGLMLSSLTGYNNEYFSQVDDLDNYDGSLITSFFGSGRPGARAFWSLPFIVERRVKDFSQEGRLSYDKGGALKAMLGVSYLKANLNSDLVNIQSEEQNPAFVRTNSTLSNPARAITKSVFGSLSYDVTDALTINVEGRYQADKIFAIAGGNGLVVPATTSSGLRPGTFAYYDTFFTKTYKNFLPRVIVNYDVTPDVMVYASYSEGVNASVDSFNTSFLNGSSVVLAEAARLGLQVVTVPESLKNYEIGLKGSLLDGRMRVSMAAFMADWSNQYNRRTSVILDTAAPVTSLVQVTGVTNAGNTRIRGLEADIWANPLDGLVMTFAGAITDTSIKTFTDPSISQLTGVIGDGFKGNSLPFTSKYSANIGVELTGDIAGLDNGFFIRSDLSYKAKQFIDSANLTWIPERTVVNMRAGLRRDKFSLEVFAMNLFNNRNYTSAGQNTLLTPGFAIAGRGNAYVNVGLPALRMIGIKAGFKF